MSATDPPPGSVGRFGRSARVLAIPVAVLVAAGGCTAALAAMGGLPTPDVRIVVGEEDRDPAGSGSEQGARSDPETSPAPSAEPTEEPRQPEASGPGQQADPSESVPLSSFNGSSTSVGPFRVEVEVAYTDSTITDGMGTNATAPSGMTYYIYRLNVTNEGSSPAIFDSNGTRGHTTDGETFANDPDAEWTVAHDYFWDEINPGTTVTTHLMFLAPEGTDFDHVLVSGQSDLRPS
ncbi:DUF4352 domain-containing protein [Nocardiopsis sp. NPDC055551]|uniref:DUF4352 domain-containing protein n=1 Tax=Nocardiopsis sp. NPDC006832 TaxID=3157188 RepID=UPI0033CE8188